MVTAHVRCLSDFYNENGVCPTRARQPHPSRGVAGETLVYSLA